IYIIRHGETILNTLQRIQGWSDAVLTPQGEEQVQLLGENLKSIIFSKIYSSDSHRALNTANIILSKNENNSNTKIITDKRLREFNFGSYESSLGEDMYDDIIEYNKDKIKNTSKADISLKLLATSVDDEDKKRTSEIK